MEILDKYKLIVVVHYIYAIFWFLGDFPFPIYKYVEYADYIVALSAITWMFVFYKKKEH
ncbi:hypothetical protein [Alkalihalobacillus sp. AL-G]|uniref:hypothetical protein n=1 Tax=Alkalihalobacillus sp. AL-G TaxID=2926399 RepID=UPI00272A9D77|nr:hypothetical protein [Alkalihalobacillus sp. AL-G]WLD94304.1 hypothetical protein MOJ78_05265 [Alkalihalobacillus sp. AL-G]